MSKRDENEKSQAKPTGASPTSDCDADLNEPDPKNLNAQMDALAEIAITAHEKGCCKVSSPIIFEDDELYEATMDEETKAHLKNLLSGDD
jgi:hypothetical protein